MNAPARTSTISASAIESFDPALGGCARKWAFSRLDNVPKPQSPGAALGSRCHELWESYLRDGTPFDLSTVEGRICDATRHLLPAPGACLSVEEAFRFDWEGVTWAGKIDATYAIVGDPPLVVLDHKTTSDFCYAKSERSSLLGHPQAPIYAVEECHEHRLRAVILAWNYVKHNVTFDRDAPPNERGYTIKRAGRPVALEPPVRLIVGRAEAEDALGKHVPTAKRMLKIIQEPPAPVDGSIARALEPNPDACDAFGGCPYRAQCGLTPQEIAARITRSFATVKKEQAMGLRDRIAAIKAERSGPTQSSAIGVQQAIEAEAAAKVARVANALEAGAQVVGASGTIQGKTLEEIAQRTATPQTSPFPQVAQATAYGPVNPPEGAHQFTSPHLGQMAQNIAASEPTPLPPAEAPTRPDAPQATRRRGRPPGSKNKVKEAPEPETTVLASGAPSEADETPDTVPAPSQELLSDDVMAEIAKRVTSRIARALLATINENEEP